MDQTPTSPPVPTLVYDRTTDSRLLYIEQKIVRLESKLPDVWTVAFGVLIGLILHSLLAFTIAVFVIVLFFRGLWSALPSTPDRSSPAKAVSPR